MLDFVYFVFGQFFNIFTFLDSIPIIGTLTFFRLILICILIKVIFMFLDRG